MAPIDRCPSRETTHPRHQPPSKKDPTNETGTVNGTVSSDEAPTTKDPTNETGDCQRDYYSSSDEGTDQRKTDPTKRGTVNGTVTVVRTTAPTDRATQKGSLTGLAGERAGINNTRKGLNVLLSANQSRRRSPSQKGNNNEGGATSA